MQATPPGNIEPPRPPRERLLRLTEVEQTVGIKKSAIYAKLRETPPAFPAPIKLSRRAVAWPESAVQAWIQTQLFALKSWNPPIHISGFNHERPM